MSTSMMVATTERTMVPNETTIVQPNIFVVDEDPNIGRALLSVGQLLGLPVRVFRSAGEFLSEYDTAMPGCLILDLVLPDINGIELQQRLLREEISLPVIAISSHASVRIAVEVMRRGAIALLEKPFQLDELAAYVRQAVELDRRRRELYIKKSHNRAKLAQLTMKEREVFDLVATGKTNKQIAAMLQLSLRAVEDRRARVMRKLNVRSVVDLLRYHSSSGN